MIIMIMGFCFRCCTLVTSGSCQYKSKTDLKYILLYCVIKINAYVEVCWVRYTLSVSCHSRNKMLSFWVSLATKERIPASWMCQYDID